MQESGVPGLGVFPMMIYAVLVLAAAAYAQHQIPRFTESPRAALLTRLGLLVLGIVFGYIAADTFHDAGVPGVLPFLLGFGAVHVPAALILVFKRARGAGKS